MFNKWLFILLAVKKYIGNGMSNKICFGMCSVIEENVGSTSVSPVSAKAPSVGHRSSLTSEWHISDIYHVIGQ